MSSRGSTTRKTAWGPTSTRSTAATRGIQERETQLRKISEQCDKAKGELKRKSEKCEEVKRELKETKDLLRKREKEKESLRKRLDERDKEIKRLKGVSGQKTHQQQPLEFAQKMEQQRKELEKCHEDVKQLRIQLKKKDGENARALEKANEKLRQSEDIWTKEEKRNVSLIEKLYNELSTREEHLLRMQEELRQKESELDEMRTYLGRENKLLRTQTEYLETRSNNASRALEHQHSLSKKLNDLEKEIAKKDEALEKIQNHVYRGTPREQNEIKKLRTENQKLQTQVKGLEARNREATHAMDDRRRQTIDAIQNELDTKKQQMRSLEIRAREIQKEKEMDQTKLGALGTENQQLRSQVRSLQAERHSLLHQYTEAKETAESFRHRLSKEFGIRLNSNETNMENISVKNRPAKVAEKFAEIESKEWVGAKEVFDDRFDDEKTNITFLLDLFKFACQRAQEIFNGFLTAEIDRLLCPIATVTCTRPTAQHVGGTPEVPEALRHEITAFLKETCGWCDVESLTQIVIEKAKERNGDDIAQILQNTKVRSFLEACSRLAWQMAVQQPPLTAVTPDTEYDDRCHHLWYSSPPPVKSKRGSRGKIDFYVWPILQQSNLVLQKGRVCLKAT